MPVGPNLLLVHTVGYFIQALLERQAMANASLGGLSSPLGVTFVFISIIFLVHANTAVALRIWAMKRLRRKYQAHDYLIFEALV